MDVKFSQELAGDSPLRAREFIAGKDAMTLATDILALGHEQFSAAFRKSPMSQAKLRGLQRNAVVLLEYVGIDVNLLLRHAQMQQGERHSRRMRTRSDES